MRLLLVDDEPLIVDILRSHLEAQGHTVVVHFDGSAAAQAWEHQDFDVLVSDIKLPKLSGIDLLRKIRAEGGMQPCLLISGHVDASLVSDQPGLQPTAVLAKPFSFADFDAALDALLAG